MPHTGLKVHTPHAVLSKSLYLFLSLKNALTCILILSSFQSVLKPFRSRRSGNRLPAAADLYPTIWFLNVNQHAVILIEKFRQVDLLPSSGEIYWGNILSWVRQSELFTITMFVKYAYMGLWSIGATKGGGGGFLQNCRPPSERNLRITDFAATMTSKFLHDSRFSLNPPLKSVADWYIGILKNTVKITNI